MKIGVISDTHGYLDPRVEKIFTGVDHILHAGDIGYPLLVLEMEFVAPVTAVLGNNDEGLPFRETEVVTLGGKTFFLHHIINPTDLPPRVSIRMQREKPDAVIFGHTHRKFAGTIDGRLFLNPGYAGKPRLGADRSVAILHVNDQGGLCPEFIPL